MTVMITMMTRPIDADDNYNYNENDINDNDDDNDMTIKNDKGNDNDSYWTLHLLNSLLTGQFAHCLIVWCTALWLQVMCMLCVYYCQFC